MCISVVFPALSSPCKRTPARAGVSYAPARRAGAAEARSCRAAARSRCRQAASACAAHQEQDFGVLLPQAQRREHVVHPARQAAWRRRQRRSPRSRQACSQPAGPRRACEATLGLPVRRAAAAHQLSRNDMVTPAGPRRALLRPRTPATLRAAEEQTDFGRSALSLVPIKSSLAAPAATTHGPSLRVSACHITRNVTRSCLRAPIITLLAASASRRVHASVEASTSSKQRAALCCVCCSSGMASRTTTWRESRRATRRGR